MLTLASPTPMLLIGKPDSSADSRFKEGGLVVLKEAAKTSRSPTPQISLGLSIGGDAVDGHRLCPGAEVEVGCC